MKRKKPGYFANKDKTNSRYEVQRRSLNKWHKERTYADATEARQYVECEMVDFSMSKPILRVVDANDGSVIFER